MTFHKQFLAVAAAAVSLVAAGSSAQANDRARFELVNRSGQTIMKVQVSPVSSNDWGPDLLGSRVLAAGGSGIVTPGGSGCQYDVRVTYRNGGTESFRNLDLCRTTQISFANTQGYVMR